MISRLKVVPFLLTLLAYSFFIAIWVYYVGPFPDRDALAQFYAPFLDYLLASKEIGNSFWFLSQEMNPKYPGSMFIPALISFLDAQDLFLSTPWLIDIFLLIPLSIIAWFSPISCDRRGLYALALFFIPITQISLKNFSLHSFNVFYFLTGLVLFFVYRQSRGGG